ncbi:type VI secretion system-associated FHA domain protein [Vibrio ostreicida]|uniref:type VI secretion system-associated FHA domain protein n=1 Tax=Vibrio ostreicida TaxID=526588 RepID=UPI003B5C73D1
MLERLVIVISKHPEEYTGAKFVELPESGGSIGRNPGCSVPLVDHNRYISSTHCLLSVYGDGYYISDVSTNGLLVNGNKLLKNQPIPIHEGDVIVLGQYELAISVERTTNAADIAYDITPERDTTDPLVNLGEAHEDNVEQGALEDIFMETRSADSDATDPVAHLEFSLDKSDDHLIRNESDELDHFVVSSESQRQIADDSLSVYSEFDAPSLIPEDWMSEADSLRSDKAATAFESQSVEAPHVNSVGKAQRLAPSHLSPEPAPSSLSNGHTNVASSEQWEELTTPTMESHSEVPAERPFTEGTPDDLLSSFKKGLGVSENQLFGHDPKLFEQMGMCLRLCINKLQSDLTEIETLKQSSSAPDTDLISLMLDLNNQSMLTPNELVEQMLDEINEHQSLYEQAVNRYVQESVGHYDPMVFEQKAGKKGFLAKQKLWDSYKLHYLESLKGVHGLGTNKLVQENYNRLLKEKYA